MCSSKRFVSVFNAALERAPPGLTYSLRTRSTFSQRIRVPVPAPAALLRYWTSSPVGSDNINSHLPTLATWSKSQVALTSLFFPDILEITENLRQNAVEAVFIPSPNFPKLRGLGRGGDPYFIALINSLRLIP